VTLVSQLTIAHLEALDFWPRVDKRGAGECWEWQGGRSKHGYGVVHVPGRVTGLGRPVAIHTHRVAAALARGSMLAPSEVVDHRCYNPPCCNPAHLDVGTQLANVRRSRKPLCQPIPRPRKDGTVRWMVRYYDYTGPDAALSLAHVRHGGRGVGVCGGASGRLTVGYIYPLNPNRPQTTPNIRRLERASDLRKRDFRAWKPPPPHGFKSRHSPREAPQVRV
jgi:hypothetical protein